MCGAVPCFKGQDETNEHIKEVKCLNKEIEAYRNIRQLEHTLDVSTSTYRNFTINPRGFIKIFIFQRGTIREHY